MKFKLKNMDSHALKRIIAGSLQLVVCLLIFSHVVSAQEFVKPPDTLIVEGVPRIPASEQRKFDENMRWTQSNFNGWTPEGDLIGIENSRVFFKDQREGDRRTINTVIRNSDYIQFQPIGGANLIYTITHPKNRRRFLFRYDLKQEKRFLLTDPNEFSAIGSYEWSNDGKYIYFTNQDEKRSLSEVYRLNPETNERRILAKLNGDANYLNDASKDFLLLNNFFSNSRSVLSILNLRTGEIVPVTNQDGYVRESDFSADGKGIWFRSNKDGEFFDLYFFDIARRLTHKVNKFDGDISGFSFSPNEEFLALKISEDGADILRIFEMRARKIVRAVQGPKVGAGLIQRFSWRNEEEIGFDFESSSVPSEIKSYNVTDKKLYGWTNSEIGEGLAGKIGITSLIKWKSFDGREISGFLLRPKRESGNPKLPVLIDVHGGPNSQYSPGFNGYLANLSFELKAAVIFPNVRGSSGFGKEFQDLDNREKREGAVKDLVALLDWIEKQPDLDSKRIAIRGSSYGAFISLALGLKEVKRIKGIVGYVPLISIRDSQNFSEKNRRERDDWEYGSVSDNVLMKKLDRLSLLDEGNLSSWKIPVFLVAGENDKRLPISSVERLTAKMRTRGIPYWYIKGKIEGHGFSNYDNYRFYSIALLRFLRTTFENENENGKGEK